MALGQGLRNLSLTLTAGTNLVLLEESQVLLLEMRRMTALSSRDFPQAPEGLETLIQMLDLKKRISSGE